MNQCTIVLLDHATVDKLAETDKFIQCERYF